MGTNIEEIFEGIDRNNSGKIQFPEFYSQIQQILPSITHNNILRLFDYLDNDKSSEIGYQEFIYEFQKKISII